MVAVVAAAMPARADDPAAAEALFREGRALFAEGKLEAACAKFKASQSAEPSPGTLLNLAACHREQGKSATAWAEFVAAARLARAQRKDKQESEATRRAAELEPTLSYLTIKVEDPVPGLEVRREGTVLEASVLGARVPVDPGAHAVEARAPGYDPFHLDIQVAAARDDKVVAIPKLKRQIAPAGGASVGLTGTTPTPPASVAPADGASPPSSFTPGSEQVRPAARVLPWVVGGVGVAALAAGGVAGFLALGSNQAAKDRCPEPSNCNDEKARSLASRRDTEALVADIGVGAGLVGVGVAVVLLLSSSPAQEAKSARFVVPVLAPRQAGLAWMEQF